MSTAINIENVVKTYKGAENPSVNGLSLRVNEGEIYGLLGPNGAGKSSTVMMICGLLKADSGTINVLEQDVQNNGNAIRKRIGIATQEIALFPSLTARENLHYFGNMYGLSGKKLQERITYLLEAFGLTSKADKQVSSYSGGMKRRLNLIASLLHEPELLILDEPTAGVDVQSRNMIIDFLQSLNKTGVTMLYSSHLMEEADRFCTRFGIIDEGKLIAQGTRDELLAANPDCRNLEELFLHHTGKSIRE